MSRFDNHCHLDGSNMRLLDSINKPDKLIDRAIELGLSGVAITDHEFIGMVPAAFKHWESIKEEHPDFKVGAGDEIYLVGSRDSGQKYYHFLLIAKNKIGWKALKELSSNAWLNSYTDRGMTRTPTLYTELENIVKKYPNSLIATTACIGGELGSTILKLNDAEITGDDAGAREAHEHIVNFLLWAKELFKDDFYLEVAPACSKEQIIVNKRIQSISKAFDIKVTIGSDAHYLKADDRYVHESYLNSKGGEREVASFYEYAYLQSDEEVIKHLSESYDEEYISVLFNNSMEIYNKIEHYNIWHNQTIPSVEVKDYPKKKELPEYETLNKMFNSDDIYDRYWVNQCTDKLKETDRYNETYLSRLEEEAKTKEIISNKLGTNIFKYPIVLQHYIDMIWESGSMVGAGRGSSCAGLNHELLGVTQLDPVKWNLPWFRYLNESRVELPDIDIDICPSKKTQILNNIKKERGNKFKEDVIGIAREELGCVMVGTYGTETSKSAIQTACRGYRSKECPNGIDSDTSAYLSSLVPVERGFVWTLNDVYYGNKEEKRKPVKAFVNEVNEYPGLIDIMFGIEGIIKQRSSHASGIIMNDEDPYEFLAYMKTPSGEVVTQFDLHTCEALGATKYDFLVTEVQDKLVSAITLMQNDNVLEKDLSLREIYNKYFHPNVLPIEDKQTWKAVQNNEVLNIFQFDSDVGAQAAKKIKPETIQELADSNGLMRLMAAEKGGETPLEKYVRYKNDISLWYNEMDKYGITKDEQKILERYFLQSYGVPPSQEQLMLMLMDKDICGFTIKEANNARRIVGKKMISKVPTLHRQVIEKASNRVLGEYVWKFGLGPQMSYSFSIIHALAYSFIGFQTAYIATHWNPIYWNTACLIVNSGSLEEQETEIVNIYEKEDFNEYSYEDLPDRSAKKKTKNSDYAKVAKALGDIISKGIKVSLVDINKSSFSFKPDAENNQILFGLKALSGINEETISLIERGRPYDGIKDFMNRCPLKKTQMISLIKAGAFDNDKYWGGDRKKIMAFFLYSVAPLKKKLTLSNMQNIIDRKLLPSEYDEYKQLYLFNKYIKKYLKKGIYYVLDNISADFYQRKFSDSDDFEVIQGQIALKQSVWDKQYKKMIEPLKDWVSGNEVLLDELNKLIFKDEWNKYASKSISSWEMDSLCFYYHEHELKNVDTFKYGIVDFDSLSTEPEVDYYFNRGGRKIPIYKTEKIIGTVLSKNDTKSTVSILTTENKVVPVKFTREYYAMFNRQVSKQQPDGTKKVMEKGWFTRGNKIMVTGFRRDDMFVGKTYKNTPTHQLYLIKDVDNSGNMTMTNKRYGQVEETYE